MAISSVVDPKGRLTLPLAVRRALGLRAGGRVSFTITDDGAVNVEPVDGLGGEAAGLAYNRRLGEAHFAAEAHEAARSAAARGLAALRGGVNPQEGDLGA